MRYRKLINGLFCSIWNPVKYVRLSGGQKAAFCWRVPERVCLSPQQITPSSPSRCPVKFSTLWGAPTSASWWTYTVSRVLPLLGWVGLQWHVCVLFAIFVYVCLKSHAAFIFCYNTVFVCCAEKNCSRWFVYNLFSRFSLVRSNKALWTSKPIHICTESGK